MSADPRERPVPSGGPPARLGGPSGSVVTGTVTAFDEAAGLGVVVSADGRSWPFHCTSIADGTRSVTVGAAVRFAVVAARRGRFEAADLRPAG